MSDADDSYATRHQVAAVVLYWLRRRGMTRQMFADRMGRSLSWVDKISRGDRQLDRLSVLRHIASVLDVPLDVLIDPDAADQHRQCPDDFEVAAIRSALRRYDVITNVFRPNGYILPEPNLASLERSVRYGWLAFQAAKYRDIGEMLPDLIREAQAAAWQLEDQERHQALTSLAWVYQLTAATAFKLSDAQLGWLAADRGIQVAEQTEDLTLIGSAARRVAHALIATQHGDDAVILVRSAAERLQPHLATTGPGFTSAYGMLLLKGSIAAAQLYRAGDVRDLQVEALDAAQQLGNANDEHWTSFGEANVLIHQVSALADMQRAGEVVEAAQRIPKADLMHLPKERRANHLLDIARGHLQAGKRDEASNSLLEANQLAPDEIRCRRSSKQILTDLMRSYPRGQRPSAALIKVAKTAAVTA